MKTKKKRAAARYKKNAAWLGENESQLREIVSSLLKKHPQDSDVDELVQRVSEQLLANPRQLDRIRRARSPSGMLRGYARWVQWKIFNEECRRNSVFGASDQLDNFASSNDVLSAMRVREALEHLLATLSRTESQLLDYILDDDYTNSSIAAALGISQHAAAQRICRLRSKLKSLVNNHLEVS